MNHEQIEAIAAVLRESPTLTEVEIRNGAGVLLRLRRPAPKPSRRVQTLSTITQSASPEEIIVETAVFTSVPSTMIPTTANVVGIFRALTGEAAISVGRAVNAGQVVGHIEAMRLLNDCLAPEVGSIASVHVEEGQPVEYGQLLFEIAPTP